MPLIVGLGNPGKEYASTRHNVGFEVVDRLAGDMSAGFRSGKGPYFVASGRVNDKKIILLKPTTYMNRSGQAVVHALNWYKLPEEEALVCYDDLDLPVGSMRLRPGGSAGTHNGMKDVVNRLGTNKIPRLRIGIGNDFPDGAQVNYVLSKFSRDQRKIINGVIGEAADAVYSYIRDGINEAMNKFNT